MKKMMKKTSWAVLLAMLCALIIPVSGFALTLDDVSFIKVDNEYFYEDFSKYSGSNITTDCNETSIGYYGDPTYLKLDTTKNGTNALVFSRYGAFAAINGPRGGHDTGANKYNIFYFNIDKTAFEDANKTLVFSYDAYVPYYTGAKQTLYSCIGYGDKGDMGNLKWMAAGAKSVQTSSIQKFMSFDTEIEATTTNNKINEVYDGNSVIGANITEESGGRWVKLQTVMQYDSTNKQYISWNYVDGQPIMSSETNDIAKLKFKPDEDLLTAIQARNSIAFYISARCDDNSNTAKDKDIIVDNVAFYLYGATSVGNGTVSGKTITIPVANTQSFTDTDTQTAPEVVKKGYLNVDTASSAKLTTEDGAAITGATITATPSEIKITAPASVGNGDKVKVDLTGVKDIAGNQIGSDSGVYTINGNVNAANKQYLQDFEGITALSEVGFNPGNISNTDTTKTFVLGTTDDKGNGLAVNYTAGSSSKPIVAPDANTTYGFSVDAASFETAGKEIEYGYDIYIPGGAYKGEQLAGYLILADASGKEIQYCSEVPWLTNTNNTIPNLKIRATNDESVKADWTATKNEVYTANGKPGVNNFVYVDYAETDDGGWVSVKSRVSYVKDSTGTGYYMTKYYINDEVVRTADGAPAIFKVQENLAPASSGRKYLRFSIYGNNGEGNPNKLIVDNIFAKVIDAEDGELTVYDFEGGNGTYSFIYNNLSATAKSYQFIIAGYDKTTGELLGVDISKKGTFAARSTGTVSSELSVSGTNTEYKVFLWNNFDELKPLKKNLVE